MIIASQKRKENIAEYLLYMWQIEDIIRAYKLDIDTIDEQDLSRNIMFRMIKRKKFGSGMRALSI